jgi:hypothetical protein
MWAELHKTYEIEKETEYFDKYKYLDRVHKTHPNWKWPGKNNGKWRPLLTQPSDELINPLKPKTKFTVTDILYQAVSRGMKYQAVEALIDNSEGDYVQSRVDKTGFIWIWHNDEKFFKEVEKKNEETEEEETECICHDITDDELHNGFKPGWQKKYKLTFPVFDIKVKKSDIRSDNSKFNLFSTDDNKRYEHTQTIDDNKSEDEKFVLLHFQCTPKNLKYSLKVQADEDKEGNKVDNYYIFENRPY